MTGHEPHDDELARRLRASFTHRMSDETRGRHLEAIGRALAGTTPTATAATAGRLSGLRRGVTAVAASLSLLVPTGVAVASQRALPGETLYDVKQATEVVWQVVDPAVRARNRLDELERLLDAEPPLDQLRAAVQRALDAVQTLQADDPLQLRLLTLLDRYDRLVASEGSGTAGHDPAEDDVTPPTSGSSDGSGDDHSGPGSGDDGSDDDDGDDRSGPGSGSDDEPTGSESEDSSGPSSDDDPAESESEDSSGSGSDDDPAESDVDDSSGSGSGSDDASPDLEEQDRSGSDSGSDSRSDSRSDD